MRTRPVTDGVLHLRVYRRLGFDGDSSSTGCGQRGRVRVYHNTSVSNAGGKTIERSPESLGIHANGIIQLRYRQKRGSIIVSFLFLNIRGEYMLQHYYPFNKKILDEFNKFRSNYKLNNVNYREGIITFDGIIHEMLLSQLKDYVLKEITTSTCYYMALKKQNADFDVLCFHAENAIVRLTSFWDYLFQILNTYLELKMIPSKRLIGSVNGKWKITRLFFDKNHKLEWKSYKYDNLGDNPYRGVFCPDCFSDNLIITQEKYFVSEKTYEQVVNDYLDSVPSSGGNSAIETYT